MKEVIKKFYVDNKILTTGHRLISFEIIKYKDSEDLSVKIEMEYKGKIFTPENSIRKFEYEWKIDLSELM